VSCRLAEVLCDKAVLQAQADVEAEAQEDSDVYGFSSFGGPVWPHAHCISLIGDETWSLQRITPASRITPALRAAALAILVAA
jgi:hypothetical protein